MHRHLAQPRAKALGKDIETFRALWLNAWFASDPHAQLRAKRSRHFNVVDHTEIRAGNSVFATFCRT